MRVDNLDLKITSILEANGRIRNKEIATMLGISEGTVRNRITKLTEAGFLKVKGLTNPNIRTDKQVAYILASVPLHSGWDETAEQIARLSDVKSVSLLAGRFDLLVEVYLEPHEMVSFMKNRLATIKSIDSTETLIAMKHYNKWV